MYSYLRQHSIPLHGEFVHSNNSYAGISRFVTRVVSKSAIVKGLPSDDSNCFDRSFLREQLLQFPCWREYACRKYFWREYVWHKYFWREYVCRKYFWREYVWRKYSWREYVWRKYFWREYVCRKYFWRCTSGACASGASE